MSVNSTVNTNVSAPTDINANRGNYPNGVYAFDMGTANGGSPNDGQEFVAGTLIDGTEKIGAYVGTIGTAAQTQGKAQTITLTFVTWNSDWNHKAYDIHVSLVSNTVETPGTAAGNNVGIASASFNSVGKQIIVRRESCQVDTYNQGLLGCVMLVQVRKRGVTKKNDA
jgi:hypothetical protein